MNVSLNSVLVLLLASRASCWPWWPVMVLWSSAGLSLPQSLCSHHLNVLLVLATHLVGFLNAAVHTGSTFQLPFFLWNVLNYFFWHSTPPATLLFWHIRQWGCYFCFCLFSWTALPPGSSHFLPLQPCCLLEDPFSWGEAQSLLYLVFPLNVGHNLLWHRPVHVSAPQLQLLSGPRKVLSVLYIAVIPVLNPHLQSEKQGSQTSIGKFFKTTSICFCT